MELLGIDIGGTGIKGAIVDTLTGELLSKRERIDTPQPADPANLAKTVVRIVKHFDYKGPVGCGFPAVIKNGVALTAGNIDPECKGTNVEKLFSKASGCKFTVLNDADVAGIAEMKLGAGVDQMGTVILITVGTGLGSGVFYDGILIPNIELGMIFGKNGLPIESYASDKARKKNELSWDEWGKRFNFFLNHINTTFTPDLFILGGGVSKKFDKFSNLISVKTPVIIANFKNNAGIIGAAIAAEQNELKTKKPLL